MKKSWLFVAAAIILLSTLLLPGCKKTDQITAPVAHGTLNLYGSNPFTLDPATSSEATSGGYIIQIFSGLMTLGEDLNPVPDIAQEWKMNTDGTVYTFTLRRDARFHDGRRVTAADFVYSWERACHPSTGSTTAATYLGDIVGARQMLAGEAGSLSGVRAVNDHTLEVTIESPKSYFLYKMAFVTTFVVDKNNITNARWWRTPNGTGPFTLKEWVDNQSLVLERFADFYGNVARVGTVNYQILTGVPMRLYETGSIDITAFGSSYIDMVTDPDGPYLEQLEIYPELSFYYLGFNHTRPPFDDVNVRKAFSMAIDKEKIASLLYRDMVQPANGILPVGLPGHNDNLSGLEYNVAGAKALIAASVYGDAANLPPITVTTAGWGGSASSDLQAIVYEWQQNLGVDVTIRQLEPERYFYNLREEVDEIYYLGWIADYPHPQNFLEILFRTGSEYNAGGYSNPVVDDMLHAAGIETNLPASFPVYQQIEQMLVDDAVCIPLWFGKNFILVQPYVRDYRPTAMGWVRLNRVYIEK